MKPIGAENDVDFRILRAAARALGTTPGELVKRPRERARGWRHLRLQLAAWLMYHHAHHVTEEAGIRRMSWPRVARALGYQSHAQLVTMYAGAWSELMGAKSGPLVTLFLDALNGRPVLGRLDLIKVWEELEGAPHPHMEPKR